ncbi:MAG: universal stress protein [Actinomycetota bacterium]
MFERILFPTDFSEVSQKAADQILLIPGVNEVHVLHVVDSTALIGPTSTRGGIGATSAHGQQTIDAWHETASQDVAEIAESFEAAGLKATYAAEWGDPAHVILEKADAEGSTIIVLGASGKGHLAEFLLGSVSDTVVRKARIPVLVIKR